MCARGSRCCADLRLGRVGVQVDTLEVEDVVLGVVAVVQRVVAWDGKRVVKDDSRAAEEGACRGGGGEERGGDVEELHLGVSVAWCVLSVNNVQLGQRVAPVGSGASPGPASTIELELSRAATGLTY